MAPFSFKGILPHPWKNRRNLLPKGLYWRSILIVVLPILGLQTIVTLSFMDRHWHVVTRRLSAAVTQDIAAIIALDEQNGPEGRPSLKEVAQEQLNLDIDFLSFRPLPEEVQVPFFSILHQALSTEFQYQIGKPFWIDTESKSSFIEMQIQLEDTILKIIARRSAAYAANFHIFLVWMVVSAFALLGIALIFLRNQIRPILRLAEAAEDFGKGRNTAFTPAGAQEVRQAGYAFLAMKQRIERALVQRTMMLNGVSHDLYTILTRFRLSVALLPPSRETAAMERDVQDMQKMLESYLAFARGTSPEPESPCPLERLLQDLQEQAQRQNYAIALENNTQEINILNPNLFKRCLSNLLTNSARYATQIHLLCTQEDKYLLIHVDDNGPGIPEEKREEVFRPFFRLDESRNQNQSSSGLGLAIARDLANAQGGDISLSSSPLGGLRVTIRLPI